MYQNIATLSDTFIGSLDNPSAGEIGRADFALIYMNEWFLFYLAMAIAGAIISWYQIYLPVRRRLIKESVVDHPYVSNNFITTIVWLIASTVLIPFIAGALISEEKKILFIQAVYEGAK